MGVELIGKRLDADDLPRYSIKDWEQWEGSWELIEGIPFAMSPMPTIKHQELNGNLYSEFRSLLQNCPDCKVHLPINFKISDTTVIHPDLMIICQNNEDEIYITKIPSIVVEIISKSSVKQDTKLKPKIYSALGIKYYVLIDPKSENAKVFIESAGQYKLDKEGRNFHYLFETEECPIDFDFSKIW